MSSKEGVITKKTLNGFVLSHLQSFSYSLTFLSTAHRTFARGTRGDPGGVKLATETLVQIFEDVTLSESPEDAITQILVLSHVSSHWRRTAISRPSLWRLYLTMHPEAMREFTERVEQLIALAQRLAEENRSLRQSQEQLMSERANLLAKNEQARSRVEAMINRLKSLEQG